MSRHRQSRDREPTMSHDFARSHRMKREATRKKAPARKSGGVPSWLWLLIGTLAGGLIMFLVYLSGVAPQLPDLRTQQPSAAAGKPAADKPGETAKAEPAAPPKRTSPVFEFYTKLPEGGQKITDIPPGAQPSPVPATDAATQTQPAPPATTPDAQVPAATEQPAASKPAPVATTPQTEVLDPIQQLLAEQEKEKQLAAKTEKKTETKPATVNTTGINTTGINTTGINTSGKLYLQAGVFRNAAEAEKLRARIAGLGLKPSMQPITNSSGETLQKVLVGPFASKIDMDKASMSLTGNKINVIPVK